jgi:hypothetical protein
MSSDTEECMGKKIREWEQNKQTQEDENSIGV